MGRADSAGSVFYYEAVCGICTDKRSAGEIYFRVGLKMRDLIAGNKSVKDIPVYADCPKIMDYLIPVSGGADGYLITLLLKQREDNLDFGRNLGLVPNIESVILLCPFLHFGVKRHTVFFSNPADITVFTAANKFDKILGLCVDAVIFKAENAGFCHELFRIYKNAVHIKKYCFKFHDNPPLTAALIISEVCYHERKCESSYQLHRNTAALHIFLIFKKISVIDT